LSEKLGFNRKSFSASLAIGITANFKNFNKFEDIAMVEFGISYQFKKLWFDELYKQHGIRLENCTYYRDEVHYFVVSAIKSNLIEYGVLLNDSNEIQELLSPSNINQEKLEKYMVEISKYCKIPEGRDLVLNKNEKADVAIFDFTTKAFNSHSTKIFETDEGKNRLLVGMVGDSLIAPFWPQVTLNY
jgi:F-actin monooxygenase